MVAGVTSQRGSADDHSRWHHALNAAVSAARAGIPSYDLNPAVGCALVSPAGDIVAVGCHRGSGTAHAEVDALAQAGAQARGATAVVTLLPCDHVGTTGSCVQALIDAGVSGVVYAHDDPTGHAASSQQRLRDAGIEVTGPIAVDIGADLLGSWLAPHTSGRPRVIWKVAISLDGRIADRAGASMWITGDAARQDVQALRANVGAVITSTQTVLSDDPRLDVREANVVRQPARVVVGLRDIPDAARIRGTDGRFEHQRTHDLSRVLAELAGRGVHRVLVECGGTLAAALMAGGLIDEIIAYQAGLVLPGGTPVVADTADGLGFLLATATRWRAGDVRIIGDDIRTRWLPASDTSTTAGT